MKFIFTGTGTSQGIPVIGCQCEVCLSHDPMDKRLRTSGVLQSDTHSIVFDTGPDFRQQMLRADIRRLDAVVFTHKHKDHTAGLDDVRAFNYQLKRPMAIYANEDTLIHLNKEYYYIFENQDYPGIPQLQLHEITQAAFSIGDIDLLPIPVLHSKLWVFGYRVGDFAYVTDASYIPPESMEKLQGVKHLVLNALRLHPHHSHFTLSQAIEIANELQVDRAYLTHISHLMGKASVVSQQLPPHIQLAHDGLEIEVN